MEGVRPVSTDAAHDLTLDTVDTPPHSGAQEMVQMSSSSSPPPSPELLLSLDNLSRDGNLIGSNDDGDEHKESNDEEDSPIQRQPQTRRGQIDRDAKRMETKLQRNLKQQQAHYARQRKLLEGLRADQGSSPSSDGSDSPQSTDGQGYVAMQRANSPKKVVKTQFRFQKDQLTSIGSLSRQNTQLNRDGRARRHVSLPEVDANDDDEDDSHAQVMLRRIKEKARAEFHRQRLPSGSSSTTEEGGGVTRTKVATEFFEEMQQQEASNDALRRQLELLRRLQLENNRFRQEARSLRERNEALKERDEIREREVKRLCDEVSEMDARAQQDQMGLATAAQTAHKLKVTQKRLTAAQSEIREYQTALQEARDARDQLQVNSQSEISDLILEVKRWKRNTKQLRQQENRAVEEFDFYKKTIAALEEEVAERRSQLKEAKREIVDLSAMIEEKTARFESVETSAADCVRRMEEGMEALQKTHCQEREKRKKVENARSTMQMQLDRMQTENGLLLEKQRELEHQLSVFKDHWKERKLQYQYQLQRFGAQLEEHVTKHKSDAITIGNMREEYDILESHLAEVEAATKDLKFEVAAELRTALKQVEALRRYLERALHNSSDVDDVALETAVDCERPRREEVWQEVPELQVVQAAISALRNETMNIVHEFQRARHLVRQQGNKLALAVERATELEHLRAEDATRMKELREQRMLAEQAREIISQEKTEVLKWSEQACEKSEELQAELKKCGQFVLRLRKELHHALKTEESWDGPESVDAEPVVRAFASLGKEIDTLVSLRDHWRLESEKQSQELQESQDKVRAIEKELAVKTEEFKESLEEMERVHNKNAHEQKLHFERCIGEVDTERATLETKLQEESARLAEAEENNAKLQHVMEGFEQDLPVFATILHLFVLVVQPLILQVSELLAQKRLLLRENAEFAQAHEQIECIGQVLKEMIPAAPPNEEKTKERQRRRSFRRAVIAVFAMNRFQHFGTCPTSSSEASAYGLCAPLKAVRSRKRACALSFQPTVIKVLPPQQTLSRLSLRPLLERLKKMEITEKVAEVMESGSTSSGYVPSSFGSLILKVVMAINPSAKELLVGNTNGIFHCQALLERRRRPAKKRLNTHDDMSEYDTAPPSEEDIPTVALIRKRILALGKRVEDLHYQRNSLQKENYEFQFQLDQQATSLKDMDILLKKTEALQEELASLRCQNDQELQRTQLERQEKDQEIQSREDELVEAQARIETLQLEVSDAEGRIARMEVEKTSLRLELDQLKSSSIEEEVKADKSKAAARRQEEEVRSLKQAVKKAHELYQKVSWQLEQEVQEKSTLQTVVNHLRRQQEQAERELREEKLRELEKSFNEADENDSEDQCEKKERYTLRSSDRKPASPSTISKRKSAFVPVIDIGDPDQRDDSPRRRRCENSISSSAASVSPLPPRASRTASRRSEEVERFLSEWQQLDVTKALSDSPPASREVRFRDDASDATRPSPVRSPASPASTLWDGTRQAQPQKSRRRSEIDKVNAAVHDYMDRIDDKLNKMYGIPPSSAIQRSSSRPSSYTRDKACENGMSWEADSSNSSLKADEVRVQQYHSDVDSYGD
ncbi:hypothetical protein PR003_g9855 [Phytophthora rubi]|uniref:Uncharacterized protein n=1 Tax=Phytophthora rubi TaxID=129364 RepID=A0A6A3MGA5_9STRA|nr:hypothetical protein PR001_g11930 [Phytophthora rubi]KAE9031602.1 hypothetical protein PR002_g9613 [Phytophthora rubi]KAE9341696.1 hypothetical protein PR003_g9855 [Phytophthora rubi]